MKNNILVLIVVLLFVGLSESVKGEIVPWADFWTNAGYHSTNGERNNFNSFVLRSEGKFGIRVGEAVPGMAIDPYLAYYGVVSQDQNYWNNNVALGAGLRILPFLGYQSTSWQDEWLNDVKFFVEALSLSILNDQATADRDKVHTTDSRIGVDVWHEWNLKDIDPNVPWAEVWGNLVYRDTNFFAEANNFPGNQFKTYLLYLQTKWGMHLSGGIRPYLCSYLTYSGVPKSWLNSFYYGAGLRMEPFREQKDSPDILRKFKMFVEVLGISWLKENDVRPASDVRFGVDFTFGR